MYRPGTFLLLLFLFGCVPKKEKISIKGLYSHSEISGSNLCDSSAIVGSDCSGGDIFFADNGMIIYDFYCQGDDSLSYDIGRYETSDAAVICTFEQKYSYSNGYMDTS